MENFFIHGTFLVKVVYLISLLIVLSYVFIKYMKRKYILSFFNIGLYISLISYFFTSLYQYNNIAWNALGYDKAEIFYKFLDKNLIINLVGTGILFLGLLIFELKNKKIKINKIEKFLENNINIETVKLVNKITIILWLVLVFSKLGFTLPIFGNRGFLVNSSLQSVYNILNSILEYSLLVYLFYYPKNTLFFINLFLLVGTGNRGGVLNILLLCYILYFYKNSVSVIKKVSLSIIVFISLLFLLFLLDKIRGGINTSILNKILYANTFSDIRDGAFILYGMEKLKITFLYGKMYLADFLSFIPSEFLKYREIYSYSNFTTKTLFGWYGHYGLRGGLFIAPYINFGFWGVFSLSTFYAFVLSKLEKMFYTRNINYKNILILNFYLLFVTTLLLPAGGMFLYVLLGYLFLIIGINQLKLIKLLNKKERN